MKLTINKDTILKAINTADSVISSKNINTILSNCLFNVSRDKVEIIATDNEMAVRTQIDASADNDFSFTANGKKLSSIIKELPDEDISITIDDSMVINIKSSNIKGNYTFYGIDSNEYPQLPEISNENSIDIEQATFKEMIKKVIYAAATDTIKPVFNSIYIISEKPGTITAIATDSRRLSMITREINSEAFIGEGIIIPLKTINEVYKLLSNSGSCKISFDSKQCYFKINETEIISRVIEGQFPNYKQIIPKEYSHKSIIETSKILDSVKRAMVFTREPANKIIMTLNKDLLHIEANTPELGQAEEELNIESDNKEKIFLGINAHFLFDTLKQIDSFSFVCGITGQMSPITIIPEDDKNYISVIMPIQIKTSAE
ncbi:MAG TPA: DNA polymerase III subunit beta [Spirochaetota bacterium]|nr:DNA polymerase III subunit beta [Spirochaetota bacterium]HPS85799.1 DNA polymerase III subunit beta [Spirochaetota bacterium]